MYTSSPLGDARGKKDRKVFQEDVGEVLGMGGKKRSKTLKSVLATLEPTTHSVVCVTFAWLRARRTELQLINHGKAVDEIRSLSAVWHHHEVMYVINSKENAR